MEFLYFVCFCVPSTCPFFFFFFLSVYFPFRVVGQGQWKVGDVNISVRSDRIKGLALLPEWEASQGGSVG